MESYTLRVILLVLGILFILGIYLWDKRNHVDARLFKRRKSRKTSSRKQSRTRDTSVFDESAAVDGLPSIQADEDLPEELAHTPKPAVAESFSANDRNTPTTVDNDIPSFSARTAFDEFESGAELPTKILQIHLISRDARISGQMILDLAAELNLQHGEFNIFHRMDEKSGKSVFSIANAVEPGSFDLSKMDELSTPGLALFSQLPAPLDAMQVYNAMLEVAERMAFIVGGELQDPSHCALTQQSIEHEKEQIIAYQVKLNKAMQELN